MSDSHNLSRKGFVNVVIASAVALMGAIIAIPAIAYLISPATKIKQKESWISVGPLENYTVGEPALFSFTQTTINGWEKTVYSYGVYVMRFNEAEQTVFSNVCTHLSCRVKWSGEDRLYLCPCHDASFDESGEVVAGPPPRALWEYPTKIEEDVLYFHFGAV